MADRSVNLSIRILSILLIIGGIALYLGWGLAYGSWNPLEPQYIGVYSLMIVMILFGALGLLLARVKD